MKVGGGWTGIGEGEAGVGGTGGRDAAGAFACSVGLLRFSLVGADGGAVG